VDDQMDRVKTMLAENSQKLVNLGEALLEHEVLEADEIRRAIAGEMLTGSKKSRAFIRGRAESIAQQTPDAVPLDTPPVV